VRRSNRVVLLFGALLAVLAFAAVIVLYNQKPEPVSTAPTELPTVYAKQDIPLGTVVTASMVEARPLSIAIRPSDAFGDPGQVIGKTVRVDVKSGAQIAPTMFGAAGGGTNQDVGALLAPGLRAMAVTVDANSGVGALINVGDRVDVVVGFTADSVPEVAAGPSNTIETITGINSTTVKVLVQDVQVVGTLGAGLGLLASPSPSLGPDNGGAALGGSELIILAVTPQQAEVIKFSQMDGQLALVLRSPKDFVDAAGNQTTPPVDTTTGIVLKTLIDDYGVLPPQVLIATGLPTLTPQSSPLASSTPLPSAAALPTPLPPASAPATPLRSPVPSPSK
jgi:pilus assembly protein CpaB